jgi:putative oxidoreductase
MGRSRDVGLLVGRSVLGGYLAVHGSQKLFGSFGGRGPEATAKGFESLGLRPGRVMATLAGSSELGGGALTALGLASPLGPVAIAGTMAVAATTHRANGALGQKGGFELPLTNLAGAVVLASTGPGRYSIDGLLGSRLPGWLRRLAVLGSLLGAATCIAMMLRPESGAPTRAEPEPEPEPESEPAGESEPEPEPAGESAPEGEAS